MAKLRDGLYAAEDKSVKCKVKRLGTNNTRIVLDDGSEKLVPSECVTLVRQHGEGNPRSRVVPSVPLEALYRRMRKIKGTKGERYESVTSLLNPTHGPKDCDYLAELFTRSERHSEAYSNISESFYSSRATRCDAEAPFAKRLVSMLGDGATLQYGNHRSTMVDYEVYPFRTRRSCCEDGRPATRIGSGGMDLLLASDHDGVLPAIGEIKAQTEMVGPTFALVQALLYAAQMTTKNQFLRLQQHYHKELNGVDFEKPRMDVLVLLEVGDDAVSDDLSNAVSLGEAVRERLRPYIRHIHFLWCELSDHGIKCEKFGL